MTIAHLFIFVMPGKPRRAQIDYLAAIVTTLFLASLDEFKELVNRGIFSLHRNYLSIF